MFTRRTLLTLLIALGLMAALLPAVALASGGSSAGDNQYVDPLSGVHTHGGGSGSSSSSSGSSSSAGTSSSAVAAASATTSTASSGTTSTGDPSAKAKTLPFTGFDDGEIAGLGAMLMAGGLLIRRRSRA